MAPPPDSNPFDGIEAYYADYRPRYGDATIDYLRERFALDESARVLDLGCGAGQLAIPLAPHVGEIVGMDPNAELLRHARRIASEAGRENVRWVVGSDADLHEGLGPLRLTTMGRSFHWMDQPRTLDRLAALTEPDGGVALVTDREWLTKGTDAWQEGVYDLATAYVEDVPDRVDPTTVEYDDPWDELLVDHGFGDVETATFAVEREWTVDGVVGYVCSLSFCSPATLGDEQESFELDLRAYLNGLEDERFVQHTEVEVVSGKKRGRPSGW